MSGRGRRPLAVLSALLLAAGVVLATVARPSEEVAARVSAGSAGAGAPLLVVGPAVLASRPGPVVVRASGSGPVLVAAGRDDDVAAWVQGAAVTTATGLQDDGDGAVVTTTATAGEAQVPDPSGSDLWTAQSRGAGSAELVLDPATGSPSALVASDGTGPAPGAVELVWTHRPVPAAAWALLGAGALGGAWLVLTRRRAAPVTVVLPRDDAEPPPDLDRRADTAPQPELLRPRGRRSAR